jgi:small ligand-binding sensory domain FIST
MRWSSALSQDPGTPQAVAEAVAALRRGLGGERADLVVAFVSPHHRAAAERIPGLVAAELPGALLVGCTGGGVIGAGHEVEERAAVSLTAAALPGVEMVPFHLDTTDLPAASAPPPAWHAAIGIAPQARPKLLLLADPLTLDAGALLAGLDPAYPRSSKFGGLASGGTAPGANRLFLGDEVFRSGVVGVALSGNLRVETIVAQGCRPIGRPMLVTRCQGNVLLELDQRPPLERLSELHEALPPRDRELFRHSLFLGLEMKEDEVEYREGELLVRNLVGIDQASGAIAVGAHLKQLQVAQFLLRDARTATEDLTRLLERYRASMSVGPTGALLFSCLGRGAHLFGRPDHDTDLFREKLGEIPLGGFFCNGEIGPVGGATFLHGYTSAFALFREESPARG